MAATEADGVRTVGRGVRVARVLVVDDEENLRELLELTLVGMGLDVDSAPDIGAARRLLGLHRYALCLTDMRLPDGNGLDLVTLIGREQPETPVAVITAYGSAENAVAALKAGAFDYLAKPVALDALRALVRSALNLSSRDSRDVGNSTPGGNPGVGDIADGSDSGTRQPRPAATRGDGAVAARGARVATRTPGRGPSLLGDSPAIAAVRTSIGRMTRSMAPVAITGESGSGKELAARLIHEQGARATGPFVAVNCGAIPENLMESEFFGYRKGAFTGADTDRPGFFSAADGGTLFLDEVADLPLAMQVKLLRAIQEKRVRKVGAVAEEPVDVRIISATHQDLARCVTEGRFRQDLFYRLNVIELRMPALRERREDIPALAGAILERLAGAPGASPLPRLSSVTTRFLESYDFPGNVRELENILERALAFSDGRVINVEDLGLRPALSEVAEREPAVATVAATLTAPAADAPDVAPGAGAGDVGAGSEHRTGDTGIVVAETGEACATALLDAFGVPRSLPDYLDRLEREAIGRALVKTRQNRTAAARELGITFRALRHRMQRLGLN
jgi:two-component system response regulator PilR (NtrC family)